MSVEHADASHGLPPSENAIKRGIHALLEAELRHLRQTVLNRQLGLKPPPPFRGVRGTRGGGYAMMLGDAPAPERRAGRLSLEAARAKLRAALAR